jgi:putative FmdB family regulatory protein
MPTYEYECQVCGHRFTQRQAMSEAPLAECPACQGEVRRLVSGGVGFILKGGGRTRPGPRGGGCGFEQRGTTCCGRQERCSQPSCEE